MKVEKIKKEFEPVVITIESKDELDILIYLIDKGGWSTIRINDNLKLDITKFANELLLELSK